MLDFKQQLADILAARLQGIGSQEIYELLEIPPNHEMGDYAFPCFRLAKTMKKSPVIIAAELTEKSFEGDLLDHAESAGGYVNFFINKEIFAEEVLTEVMTFGDHYGGSDVGRGKIAIVEFSSPNIAKPFHIGHIRSTVIGNSIAKIFAFSGYKVIRINHLGDYGTQFGKLIVAYRKWGKKEELEQNPIQNLLALYVQFHEEAERDPSLEDEARLAFKYLEEGSEEEVALWKWFREESLKEFSRVYQMLDIDFDSYAGESFYSDKMQEVMDILKEKNLLVESEGAEIVDLTPYNMSPALIRKRDGSTLYITRDIAAAIYRKREYQFDENIYVVASQQNLHFEQWFKIIELMGFDWADQCVHVNFGLVSLDDGTMSTRKGKVVFLEDVLNRAVEKTEEIIREKNVAQDRILEIAKEVGIGAVIFQELSGNRIKDYTFSWDKVLNFEGETGPYVQYTHARSCSVLRNAKMSVSNEVDFQYIITERGYELIKLIQLFPDVIQDAKRKYEPSIITRHIVNVAQAFNRFYHDEHILTENEQEQKSKLLLVEVTRQTLKNGLTLLGMKAPEKM